MRKPPIEIRIGSEGYEVERLGGKVIAHPNAEARMLALGCPAELADGSVFESLAAQRRSKKYVPSVMPVATNTGRDVDMYLRRAARAAGELIDADHRRRAVEIGRQITAEKN